MWFKLTAYNSQTLYGWTDDEDVVEAACESLNRGREINHYVWEELSERVDESDGGSLPLSARGDLIFDADTRPDSFTAGEEQG